MNIGCFKEACEQFLGALKTHSGKINISKTLWETLARCFVLVIYYLQDGETRLGAKEQDAKR